jgi:hypothetical protein
MPQPPVLSPAARLDRAGSLIQRSSTVLIIAWIGSDPTFLSSDRHVSDNIVDPSRRRAPRTAD